MFVALERRISDISISPAGGEPTATPHGAAGAARAADVPAGSATPACTPAAMPQGAAGTAPSGFASGRRQLESAIKTRRWPDGKHIGVYAGMYTAACTAMATSSVANDGQVRREWRLKNAFATSCSHRTTAQARV
jgi:hypothetical protein